MTTRAGMIIVLSSPSGAGKSTLSRMLLERDDALSLSVSVTTRAARDGEQDGKHYHFIDQADYDRLAATGALLEYAQVFDHYYGTPKQPVMEALEQGRDILFDIDWQGTQQIHSALPNDVVRIFILPPSRAELENRLRKRAQDAPEVIARRMHKADQEISHFQEYDWVLINRDLEATCKQIQQIIATERQRLRRQPEIYSFAKSLLSIGYGEG